VVLMPPWPRGAGLVELWACDPKSGVNCPRLRCSRFAYTPESMVRLLEDATITMLAAATDAGVAASMSPPSPSRPWSSSWTNSPAHRLRTRPGASARIVAPVTVMRPSGGSRVR
jgi:hypothetical protein